MSILIDNSDYYDVVIAIIITFGSDVCVARPQSSLCKTAFYRLLLRQIRIQTIISTFYTRGISLST